MKIESCVFYSAREMQQVWNSLTSLSLPAFMWEASCCTTEALSRNPVPPTGRAVVDIVRILNEHKREMNQTVSSSFAVDRADGLKLYGCSVRENSTRKHVINRGSNYWAFTGPL